MSTPSKKNEHITIRVEPEIKADLEGLAHRDDRTLSAYVARVLKQHLQEAKRARAK